MAKITFLCGLCRQALAEEFDEEIARAELARDFPEDANSPVEELAKVCDDCYKKILNILEIDTSGHSIH